MGMAKDLPLCFRVSSTLLKHSKKGFVPPHLSQESRLFFYDTSVLTVTVQCTWKQLYLLDIKKLRTGRMKSLTIFSGALHLLHHYKSNFIHLLAFKNLVIEFYNAKR